MANLMSPLITAMDWKDTLQVSSAQISEVSWYLQEQSTLAVSFTVAISVA